MEETIKISAWRTICGYEGLYLINLQGGIKSLQKRNPGKIIKSRIDRGSYLTIRLFKGGKCKTQYLHRLLAVSFIPNPDSKMFVNHIDGNKLNNSLTNLEWATHSENIKHAYEKGLCKSESRNVAIVDICTNKKFPSIKMAAASYLIPYSTCKAYLNGGRKNITCLRYLKKDAA